MGFFLMGVEVSWMTKEVSLWSVSELKVPKDYDVFIL